MIVARLGTAGVAGIVLWHALFAVLAADRGLDFTDEGLYLLAAQPPSLEAAWGTPAGWHTAPLFRVVGYDVAAFRTLGAFLLVVSSGVLGLLAIRVGRLLRERELVEGRKDELLFGAAMGGLAGFLYYGGLLRTPSYNWVTVFGATVAAVGLLQIVVAQLQQHQAAFHSAPQAQKWHPMLYTWGVVIAGFGTFFTVPAKPTTPIFFAVLAIPILGLTGGRRFVIRTLLLITGTSLSFLVAAVIIGMWPTRFVPVFLEVLAAPVFFPEQNLFGALLSLPRFPLDLLQDFRAVTAFLLTLTVFLLPVGCSRSPRARRLLERRDLLAGGALVGLGVLALAWWTVPTLVMFLYALPVDGWSGTVMGNRSEYPVEGYVASAQRILQRSSPLVVGPAIGLLLLSLPSRWRTAAVPVLVIALLEVNRQLAVLMSGGPADIQFVRGELTRGTFIVGLGLALLAGVTRAHHREGLPAGRPRVSGQPLAAVVALWLFAVSTGFGSGHGLVRQAALAAGILISALLLGVASLSDPHARRFGGVTVGVLVLSTALLYGTSNLLAPFRTEPISAQTVPVSVGVDDAKLRLDGDAARLLADVSRAARSAGWEDGTPMLNVVSRWPSTISWHLGATVPDSLILTIGGYGSGSEDRLDFSLDRYIDARFRSAWILVTAEYHERRGESLGWAQRAADRVGRSFPDDYLPVFQSEPTSARWVAEFGAIELWRPKDD